MRISGPTLLLSALAAIGFSTVGETTVQRQVTVRPPDSDALLARTLPEFQAVALIQEESDPSRLLRLLTDFEKTYVNSAYRHVVLLMRWQAFRDLEVDPEDIIEAARDALAAQNYFLNGRSRRGSVLWHLHSSDGGTSVWLNRRCRCPKRSIRAVLGA